VAIGAVADDVRWFAINVSVGTGFDVVLSAAHGVATAYRARRLNIEIGYAGPARGSLFLLFNRFLIMSASGARAREI
jgi:hypothetical protein